MLHKQSAVANDQGPISPTSNEGSVAPNINSLSINAPGHGPGIPFPETHGLDPKPLLITQTGVVPDLVCQHCHDSKREFELVSCPKLKWGPPPEHIYTYRCRACGKDTTKVRDVLPSDMLKHWEREHPPSTT